MNLTKRSNKKWLVAIILLASATLLFLWRMLPYSTHDMQHSVVKVEHRFHYALMSGDSTLLYFDGISADSMLINPSDSIRDVVEYSAGCWVNAMPLIPSCKGRIATYIEPCDISYKDTAFVRKVVGDELTNYDNRTAYIRNAQHEVRYYIDTHGVNDDGFKQVENLYDNMKKERESLENIAESLRKAYNGSSLHVRKEESIVAEYKGADGRKIRKECRFAKLKEACVILQLTDSVTPENVIAVSTWHLLPFKQKDMSDTVFVVGKTYIDNAELKDGGFELIPEYLEGDSIKMFPKNNISKGAPVFTRNGIFVGILGNDKIIRRKEIRKSF